MSYPSSPRCSEHSPVYISGPATVCLVHRESAAPPELPKPSQAPRSHQSSDPRHLLYLASAQLPALLPQLHHKPQKIPAIFSAFRTRSTTNSPIVLSSSPQPPANPNLHALITSTQPPDTPSQPPLNLIPSSRFLALLCSLKSSSHHQSPLSFSPLNPLI